MKHFIYSFAIATLALTPLMGEDQENSGTETATEQVAESTPIDQLLACAEGEENVDVEVASSYPRPVRGACRRCNRGK